MIHTLITVVHGTYCVYTASYEFNFIPKCLGTKLPMKYNMHLYMYMCNIFCIVAPNITDFAPSQQTVTSPAPAVFTCNATGRPRPTIQWYRVELEDARTPLTGEDTSSGMRGISSTLTISNTDASDATDYVCVASNIVDSTEMTGSLIVYGEFVVRNVSAFYVHS